MKGDEMGEGKIKVRVLDVRPQKTVHVRAGWPMTEQHAKPVQLDLRDVPPPPSEGTFLDAAEVRAASRPPARKNAKLAQREDGAARKVEFASKKLTLRKINKADFDALNAACHTPAKREVEKKILAETGKIHVRINRTGDVAWIDKEDFDVEIHEPSSDAHRWRYYGAPLPWEDEREADPAADQRIMDIGNELHDPAWAAKAQR